MKQFDGFPARVRYTPIPDLFFSGLLPQITDLAELKTTLHVFWMLYHKRGYPRFATLGELLGDVGLMSGLSTEEKTAEESLRRALELAAGRGILLHLVMEKDGAQQDL